MPGEKGACPKCGAFGRTLYVRSQKPDGKMAWIPTEGMRYCPTHAYFRHSPEK